MIDQEVISNILNLLDIMEEGLSYIKEKIMELNKEAAMTVLSDTLAAFSSIETAITPMLDELEENQILEKTEILREKLDIMVREYEKEDGQMFYEIIQFSLEPAFKGWKEEIELRIRPYVAS